MINSTEVPGKYDKSLHTDPNNNVRQQIINSPLLALGAAIGAGVLAGLLFKPRSKGESNLAGNVMKSINGISLRKKIKRDFKAVVGSLALGYLNRKLKNKLHLH